MKEKHMVGLNYFIVLLSSVKESNAVWVVPRGYTLTSWSALEIGTFQNCVISFLQNKALSWPIYRLVRSGYMGQLAGYWYGKEAFKDIGQTLEAAPL